MLPKNYLQMHACSLRFSSFIAPKMLGWHIFELNLSMNHFVRNQRRNKEFNTFYFGLQLNSRALQCKFFKTKHTLMNFLHILWNKTNTPKVYSYQRNIDLIWSILTSNAFHRTFCIGLELSLFLISLLLCMCKFVLFFYILRDPIRSAYSVYNIRYTTTIGSNVYRLSKK